MQSVFTWHFKRYQVNEGLSENTVNCMLQDEKGFLWIGTKDGLNKFDGTNFKIFRNWKQTDRMGSNFIQSMVEGENNDLYIGTDDGVYIMDTGSETFERLESKLKLNKTLIHNISSLWIDKKGILWIATNQEGVYVFNIRTKELQPVVSHEYDLTKNICWKIFEDRSGVIWVGTQFGLFQYNANSNQLEPEDGMMAIGENRNMEILSIFEDKKGNLWLGTWLDGILFYNKQRKGYKAFCDRHSKEQYITHVRSFLSYDHTHFLVGSDDGLFLFDTETEIFNRIDIPYNRHSLGDQNVYNLMSDREGGIWVGTYFGGLNYLNPSIMNLETYLPDNKKYFLSGKAVSQFCEDEKGNLWVATEDGGLNYFDTKTKQFSQPIQTSYHNIHSLLLDGDRLWIGTFSRGLDVYNLKNKQLKNYQYIPGMKNSLCNNCVFSFCKTKAGEIYVGTISGLSKYNEASDDFTRIAIDSLSFVYNIKEDSYKNLWIACCEGSGIARFNLSTRQWTFYDKSLPDNPIGTSKIIGLYIDNQKRLWASSDGNGIFLYDYEKDDFTNFSEKDGLPNNVVYGILDDQFGNLWVSSNKGLASFNPDNVLKQNRYIQEDGLQSNEFNYKSSLKTKDGKLYFGGINGFNCFYAQDLNENINEVIPPVEITKIQLLGESNEAMEKQLANGINKKEVIRLPYNYSSFMISYVSLSFIAPGKNQYAYRLEGVDLDWNYVGNNKSVTYINLAPGKYTFKVKASNNHNIWNETGAELKFEILPPFWLSLPAKIVYLLLIITVVYFVTSFFIRKNKKKHSLQLENYKKEQETASFKSKIDFFTTIAHEIRTPVSLIKAPLEEIIVSGDGNENTKQNLSIIEKNSERLNSLIDQLLDFRKMDAEEYVLTRERIDLKKQMVELFERFNKTAQSKKIDFQLMVPDDAEIIIVSDSDALTKIIGNFLTNALKFTKDRIVIHLQKNTDDSFTVSVQDNGKGIPDDLKTRIFDPFYQVQKIENNKGSGIGLFLAKRLSEMLGGRIQVVNNPSGGIIFSFTFKSLPEKEGELPVATNGNPVDSQPNTGHSGEKVSILLVEDNPDMLHFIANALKSDYLVFTSGNAMEALKMIDKKMYDVIITDIMMPEMDGMEFTKQLKENINFSHIPIILLSAKTDNNTKIEGLKSGANVFIEKPFSTSYLRAQIASLLSNRQATLDLFNRSPLLPYSILTTNTNDQEFIKKINEEIDKHISDSDFSIESLTDKLFVSRSNLQRKLKSICGNTPGEYLRNYRLRKAAQLLLENRLRVNEVAFNVGFSSASYFTKSFVKQFGMLPKDFMQGETEEKYSVKNTKNNKFDILG